MFRAAASPVNSALCAPPITRGYFSQLRINVGTSQLSAVNSDIRTRCSEILSGLTAVERLALKAISNGEPAARSFLLLGKFKTLGLIEHNGQRIALTGDGWMVLRLCNYGSAACLDRP